MTIFTKARGRTPHSAQVVSEGRVSCPRQGFRDVDVDACFECGFAKKVAIDDRDGPRWVACRALSADRGAIL